ncbi:MAG: serine hydrolase [Acidobacteriia bacterium]|nr:serine hydrolase [Terriglobia bacterium]
MKILVLLLAAALCPAQDIAPKPIANKVDEYMQARVRLHKFMGSVLVARDGKVLVSKGYGSANLELDVPNTPQTKFRLGSITKQFVALATLQLEERGKLKVSDPVCQYLENCPEAWKPVTIHHLLSHTSGIWNFTSSPDYSKQWMLPSRPAKTMEKFRDKPLEFEPGSKWSYSNSGYILLALVLEKASGVSYEEYMQRNIFEPAGMQDSGHDTYEAVLKHRASGYAERNGRLQNAPYHDMSIPIGGGDLYSTVEDMLRWDQALYSGKLAQPESIARLFTPVKNNYGYGWTVDQQFNRTRISHGGGINGFVTFISRYPQDKSLVVVLSNHMNANPGVVAGDLAAILFGMPYEIAKPNVAVSVDPKLYDAYVGKYQLAPNFILSVTRDGDRLLTQATGQGQVEIFPESETKFFLKVVEAKITFVKDSEGKVNEVILHQGGRDMPAKRVP